MPDENQQEQVPFDWRSALVQAIGIILGFSLAFLGSWSLGEGDWDLIHIPPLTFLVAGNAMLIATIHRLISPDYQKTDSRKLVRLFTWGMIVTLVGFVMAIGAAAFKGY